MNAVFYSRRATAIAKARRASTGPGLEAVQVRQVGRRSFVVVASTGALDFGGRVVAIATAGAVRFSLWGGLR